MRRVIKPRNKLESTILETVFVDDKNSQALCLNLSLLVRFACQSEIYGRFCHVFHQLDTTLTRYPHTESDLI